MTTATVSLARPVPDGVQIGGSVVENITWTPTIVVSGNTLRSVPTRGVLVTTRKPVLIADNRFESMSMASIFIKAAI